VAQQWKEQHVQASTPNDDVERLLREGIGALKAGDNARARELLGQAIRSNPRDERPWLWLSGAVETDAERRQCLERVLAINPQNAAARSGLAMLASAAHAPATPAAPTSAISSSPVVAPTPVRPNAATPVSAPPPSPPSVADIGAPMAVDPLAGLRPTSAPRRVNPRLVAAIVLVCVVVALGAIAVIRGFGGSSAAAQPTTAAIAVAATEMPTATTLPTPTRVRPTATATPTATPSPTAPPTSTPTAAEKLVLQGMAKATNKDYRGAIVLYNQALARDSKNTEAYFQRGQARDGLDDPQSAIKNYTLVVEINPNHGAAFSARGDARLKLKDKPGALEDYQRAAEIYTSSGDTERAAEIAAKIKALQ
jgi:Tfp pilus assembly protein PilF